MIGSLGLGLILGISAALAGESAERRQELAAIKTELKPLRERAYKEADVIAARARLDAAYREYWAAVRTAMERLDPKKKPLIKKDIELRQSLAAIATHPAKKEPAEVAPKKAEKSKD